MTTVVLSLRWWSPARRWAVLFLALLAVAGVAPRAAAEPPAAVPAAAADKPPPSDEQYLELFKLFADAFDQIDRNYVKEVDRRRLIEAGIRGMLAELDPHSGYIGPEQLTHFKAGVDQEFGGIGVQVSLENNLLQVISPLVGSPAYRAGLMAGDRILEIDGQSTKGLSMDDAVRRMQGPVGTEVTLKVAHPDGSPPQTLTLRRELIHLETVLGDTRDADNAWQWMYDDQQKIGYLRVSAFGRATAEELRKALETLNRQQLRGLILDLRFNPGGLLTAAIEVSDLFIARGRIVSTAGRNTKPKTWEAKAPGTFTGFPMAVLVNRYSASASEIVAACLQDHRRAVVIGERTWGKGSVQNVVELEDGASVLKLTTAGYHRPNGKNIHRFPDSKDSDDWGVIPNDGFAIPVSAAETMQIMSVRREKDVVHQPSEVPKPEATKPEIPKPEIPKPEIPKPEAAKPTAAVAAETVDRQLQKALDYLREQLTAAAQEPTVTARAEPTP